MNFLIGYTIFTAVCWYGIIISLMLARDRRRYDNRLALIVPCIVLTGFDLIGWIAFLLNKVF